MFVHPELVIAPGLDQIGAAFLVGISTIGISFSSRPGSPTRAPVDAGRSRVLAACALLALFVPDYSIASVACVPVLVMIGYWVMYRRRLEAGEPEVVELDAKALGALGRRRRRARHHELSVGLVSNSSRTATDGSPTR